MCIVSEELDFLNDLRFVLDKHKMAIFSEGKGENFSTLGFMGNGINNINLRIKTERCHLTTHDVDWMIHHKMKEKE